MNDEFSPLIFLNKEKEKIQKLSYRKWEESNKKGIIEIVTGVGKTQIGLMSLIKHRHLTNIFIVVPSADLLKQWYDDIVKYCQVSPENVGRVGGKYKEVGRPITIGIINSIRDKAFRSELLILDEYHLYHSKKNSHFLLKGNHKRIMGLTATMKNNCINLPIVYKMEQKEAVDKGLICPYKIVNIGCNLTPMEQEKYNRHNMTMKVNFPHFGFDLASVFNSARFSNDAETKNMAMTIVRAIQHRKSLVGNSISKLDTTIKLIKDNKNKKILLFCEYVKTADYIIKQLKKEKILGGKYHSKMKQKEKDVLFDKFRNNEITIMCAVKSLKQGTNIPDCDSVIIVSGNSVKIDIIQQAGRALRLAVGKDYSTIYQIYCKDTKDEDWTKSRTKFVKDAAIGVEWK